MHDSCAEQVCASPSSSTWVLSIVFSGTGVAHERDSASDKCTMINPLGQRHLWDVPSAPIVRSFSEVPQVEAATNQGTAACADRRTAGPEKSVSFSAGRSCQEFLSFVLKIQFERLCDTEKLVDPALPCMQAWQCLLPAAPVCKQVCRSRWKFPEDCEV